ncbi:hypothetical protein Lalb_Chr13g0294791 [Lupinus albus]|uniref:Uncharacterized protein n=1 Tax=Lupinus albus TaxID=3870 RepID=A0A6A4PHY8_LUPAL|nr:hypothetical protein Lalb_Chr13g0294791 [Lupinus albus]
MYSYFLVLYCFPQNYVREIFHYSLPVRDFFLYLRSIVRMLVALFASPVISLEQNFRVRFPPFKTNVWLKSP